MRSRKLHYLIFAPAVAAVVTACGSGRDAAPTASAAGRQPASEVAQRMSGLSHMPRVENPESLTRSLARHYPGKFAGIRPATLVLMDVRLDEKGRVLDATAVDRPAGDSEDVTMVLVDPVPGSNTPVERSYQATYDPAFGPAARAALREVHFEPSLRNGQPVPYTLRMTVEFIYQIARAGFFSAGTRMTAHRRTLAAAGALLATMAFPADAFGCWSLCVDTFGYGFGANGTAYELTRCTQTWSDGSNNVHTVCRYTNVRMQ